MSSLARSRLQTKEALEQERQRGERQARGGREHAHGETFVKRPLDVKRQQETGRLRRRSHI